MDPLPHPCGAVTLRRLRPTDRAAFLAYRGDPEVARYQGWKQMDSDAARDFLTAMAEAPPFPRGAWWQIGIADAASDALIGDLGFCLSEDGTELELGITLARAAQGHGRAGAAMHGAAALVRQETEAARITVITDARNGAALRLIARLGLSRAGTLHEMGYPEPVFHWSRPTSA